jgi:hypothetical protein
MIPLSLFLHFSISCHCLATVLLQNVIQTIALDEAAARSIQNARVNLQTGYVRQLLVSIMFFYTNRWNMHVASKAFT